MILDLTTIDWTELFARSHYVRQPKEPADFPAGQAPLLTGAASSIGSELAKAILAARLRQFIVPDSSAQSLFRLHNWLPGCGQLPEAAIP